MENLVHWFEVRSAVVIYPSLLIVTIFAVRKLAYQLYLWFPNALRVYQFSGKRESNFYWVNRVDSSTIELLRLYTLWIMLRFDKHLPLIDCERQAAKAQYFHDKIGRGGVTPVLFRCINPKAWPVFFVRRLCRFLLPAFFNQRNCVVNDLGKQTTSDEAGNKSSHAGSIAEMQP